MDRSKTERTRLVVQLERALEKPMIALSIAWIAIVVVELTRGESRQLTTLGHTIWAIFVLDLLVKLAVAPRRLPFLKRNWATVLSLVLPAFRLLRVARVLRAARVARVARGLRVAKLLGGLNRSLRALRLLFQRRGVGYVAAATVVVLMAGAAGMSAFERGAGSLVFDSYASSLWWTAMLLTSLGSEQWPRTGAGRWLALLLGVYGFTVFGYLTATLASHFVDQDKGRAASVAATGLAPLRGELQSLRRDIGALRELAVMANADFERRGRDAGRERGEGPP
jgi:voltage-gated potassium channel